MVNEWLASAPDLTVAASLPAHLQIEQWLMTSIAEGTLMPGDRLPKEQDLSLALGVSRMTLRQSLASLEARGVIERVPGRQGGTFILEPKIECDITGLAGFTEQLRRGHVRASARIEKAEVVAATVAVAKALELERGDHVYEIVRVRSVRARAFSQPLALERSYLPTDLFPGLLNRRLTGSLYARMRRDYGLAPKTATEYLEPYIADAAVAELLAVVHGSALLLIERTASSASGRPVEYARDLFRPDRIRVSVRTMADQTGELRSVPLRRP
ncbi:MAG: GntR family transcriptional regulator [Nocardioidaceae bacterium]